jgi:hypothetical protein
MNLSCSKCGSDHTQKLSSIYASGAGHRHATSHTSGMVIDNTGNVGGLSATTSTSSTYRSELADRIAPPQRLTVDLAGAKPLARLFLIVAAWWGTTIIAMGLDQKFFRRYEMVTGYMGSSDPVRMAIDHTGTCFLVGLLGGAFAFYLMAHRNVRKAEKFDVYNKTVYEPAMKEWQSKYYCHRCDNVFKPNA